MRTINNRGIHIGPSSGRLTLIAGPCVAEGLAMCRQIAEAALHAANAADMAYVFKASFDKANRTSIRSYRGPGIDEGLDILAAIRDEFGVPVLTDIHEPWQAARLAEVVDMIQVPAFLCRQTDLLAACAATGIPVNVKKGQFLAPWDMANVVAKLEESGCRDIVLTERGASFGYNTLVADMSSLAIMRSLGYPVCMDATHAVQQPGGAGTLSGGRREFVPHLARAAAAVGIDALFLEVHLDPEAGRSDPATMLPLAQLPTLLADVAAIDRIVRPHGVMQDSA